MNIEELKATIRDVPDFPKKGIIFKDITTLLKNPTALRSAIDALCEAIKDTDIDCIAGIEARGFIFGAMLADRLKKGFILVRKPGKLPAGTESVYRALNTGTRRLQHRFPRNHDLPA